MDGFYHCVVNIRLPGGHQWDINFRTLSLVKCSLSISLTKLYPKMPPAGWVKPMRRLIFLLFVCLFTGGLLACNSNETLLSQKPANQAPPLSQTPASQPSDSARRITADELHKLWEKNDVMIIDTRGEAA